MNTKDHPVTVAPQLKSSSGLRISLMGSEGSGKTCFFAGLAWLGSATQKGNFGLVGRDTDSQRFINGLRDTIARHEMPTPSFATDELSLDVIYRDVRIGIDIEDFAGEDFREVGSEIRTDSQLFNKICESRYLVLFLDIEKDVDGDASENAERLDAVLNLLSTQELGDCPRKLAIVLTKSDLRGFVGTDATSAVARDYLAKHKEGLYEKIGRLGFEKQFFFLAPLGRPSLADGAPPSPFGYEALFSWIVDDLRNEKIRTWCCRHRFSLYAAMAIGFVSAIVGVVLLVKGWIADHILEDPNKYTHEQIQSARGMASQSALDKHIDMSIDQINRKIESTDSIDGLMELQTEAASLKKQATGVAKNRLDELDTRLRDKREDILISRIRKLDTEHDLQKTQNAVTDYYNDTMINHKRRQEVEKISSNLKKKEESILRNKIRQAAVISGKPDTLRSRCDLVEKFPFRDKNEKEGAHRAVAVARLFIADLPYHVVIGSAVGVSESYRTRLEFSNLGPKSPLQKVETEHLKSSEPQWNKEFDFRWCPGDRIRVEWYWKASTGLASTIIGNKDFNHPWTALLDVLGGAELKPETGLFHANLKDTPRATITCKEFPTPKKDLQLFKHYIAPGTYWEN